MAKTTTANNNDTRSALNTTENYAFEPARIGPVLKQKAEALGLKPKHVTSLVKREKESIYRIYNRKYLTMPEMKTWSELLQVNLFALYHPNVKPLPSEADVLRIELEAVKKERDELRNELGFAKNRIIKLEGQVEKLDEQVDVYMRRKG